MLAVYARALSETAGGRSRHYAARQSIGGIEIRLERSGGNLFATEQGYVQRGGLAWRLAVIFGATLAACLIFVSLASAATITVNSLADDADDNGECTLREAITAANDNAASGATGGECVAGQAAPIVDGIAFAAGGTGTISPATLLPTITEVVDVDGSTAAGEVTIDGGGSTASGFTIMADGSTVEGLTITSFLSRGIDLNESDNVIVRDNLIGTDEANSTGLGNPINVNASFNVTGAVIEDNVIADASFGVALRGATVSDIVVIGNRIGTNSTGTTAIPNTIGIQVSQGAKDVRIGGLAAGDGNLISGNSSEAINMSALDPRSTGNQVLGNRIGTTGDGESALPNSAGTTGVAVNVNSGVDGAEFRGNLISGNAGGGIRISDSGAQTLGQAGPTGNVIAGNRLGVVKDGDTLLSNGSSPIKIDASNGHAASGNTVGGVLGLTPGGACTGDCNVIGEDSSDSVVIVGSDTANTAVLGNHIGVDVAGTSATDSGDSGVFVTTATGSTIGSPVAPNVIGAGTDGIEVAGSAPGTVIQSNLLGTGSNGTGDFGPTTSGIELINAVGILVGGSGVGEGNTIAHSGVRGVFVNTGSDEIALLGNEIFDSGALGIDLAPVGVTPNDEGFEDADPGVNGLQNFPLLQAAVIGGSTHIVGSLDSTANTDFRIEFFSNAVPDGLGHGEGELFLGATTVKTDVAGLVDFVATVPADTGAGASITATATELDGSGDPLSTSEFAANIVEGTGSCDSAATAGDDLLCGTPGVDTIDGLGGNDVILGLGGADVLGGSAGNDLLSGDGGADVLTGGAGLDELRGGDDGDTLQTNDGGEADMALCGAGADTANGDTADTFSDCETVSDGTTTAATPPPDTTPPQLTLSGKKKQGSKKQVFVKAVCEDEICDLAATGTIKIKVLRSNGKVKVTKKFDLKEATKDDVAAGVKLKLKLKLTSKAKKKLKTVISKKTSKATVKVTATDAAGNSTNAVKFKVKVKK